MKKNSSLEKITLYETPKQSPGFLLWHVSTSWRSSIETVLKTFDLTHPQFVILATLGWLTREGDLVTQRSVGKMAGLDPNTASQVFQSLEQKKLLIRKASCDARAKNPILTQKGKDALTAALPAVEKADVHFFQNLSPEESKTILNLFQKLIPTKDIC